MRCLNERGEFVTQQSAADPRKTIGMKAQASSKCFPPDDSRIAVHP
jgi:hypothetical protein